MTLPTEVNQEFQFWSRILADHAQFILESLKPDEERLLRQAAELRGAMVRLHAATRDPLQPADATLILRTAQSLLGFKEYILDQALAGKVGLHMSPTLLIHMLAEGQQFLEVARWLKEGQVPPLAIMALDQHNLWLSDAAGHAAALGERLDPVEFERRQQALAFEQLFNGMHRQGWELWRGLRTNPRLAAPVRALNQLAVRNTDLFRRWLEDLACDVHEARVMSSITPMLIEHMVHEEVYFIEKLRAIEAAAP